MKYDEGKLRITLVPMEIVFAIARVRMFGVSKYKDPENWRTVSKERYKDAMMRHMLAYVVNENSIDEESGLNHLEHVACNVAFLLEIMKEERENVRSDQPTGGD